MITSINHKVNDMRDPTAFLGEEFNELVEKDLDWKLRELQGPSKPKTMVDGKEVILLNSNNYHH